MVLWISSISSRQSTDSVRRWTQQSLSCCVPLFIRTQQYLSYLCVSLALWSASTTAATTTTASNDNYNTTKKRHRAKPYLPPPPPALSASSYASNPKPRPRRVPSQASLVSAPLWVGLNGFPASREVLPGLARLLALLVAFTFSAVRLPPLWAAHARAWHRDTSSHHQRGRRLARSDWRRMEVDRVASGNLSSLSDHHNA